MKIAVLIVNWNSWALLERCLSALSNQTVSNFCVLVADNGSAEPTPAELAARFPDVQFFDNRANLGFAVANNRLLEQCGEAEWVALLNPDAFPDPRWLESMQEAIRQYREFSSFASRLLCAENPGILDGEGDVYHCTGLAWRAGHGQPVKPVERVREIFGACAAAALYRHSAIEEVGGFDEDFFCYFEDIDLSFRLRLAGHRCALVPRAVVHHLGSATSGGKHSDFAVYHGHRNLVWAYVKNMPDALFWLLLPLHLLFNGVTVVWFTIRGQGRTIVRAKLDALLGVPRMWRKRKAVQARRRVTNREVWDMIDKGFSRR